LRKTLDTTVEEIIRLGYGFSNRTKTNIELTRMSNERKVTHLAELMNSSAYFERLRTLSGWKERTDHLVDLLHKQRHRRNALLHSNYLFEFIGLDLPVLRSDHVKFEGKASLEQEFLSAPRLRLELSQLANFCFVVGQYKVQVVSLVEDPDA
jgi:hypothetical protein